MHLIGFYCKTISWCTVLWMSKECQIRAKYRQINTKKPSKTAQTPTESRSRWWGTFPEGDYTHSQLHTVQSQHKSELNHCNLPQGAKLLPKTSHKTFTSHTVLFWIWQKPFKEGNILNHLTPNDHYMGRTAQLTSRCCILYIYSTNICTEYFKHAA